jgi:Helix-turn-helix domain
MDREPDEKLAQLFDRFRAQVISPGGAAAILGVSRKTVHTLCKRGVMRAFASDDPDQWGPFKFGPRWVYIPLIDVVEYAERTGRGGEPVARLRRRLEELGQG